MRSFLIIFSLVLLSACAVQVKTFQKPNLSFDEYTTWCWLQGCEVTYQGPDYYYDEKAFEEISNAIAFNMHEKGYVQGDENSDLLLNFYVVLKEDSTEVDHFYEGDYELREWFSMQEPEYQRFMRGSLTIDVVDRAQSEMIWRSVAVKYFEINPTFDRDKIWEGVTKALKKIPEKE